MRMKAFMILATLAATLAACTRKDPPPVPPPAPAAAAPQTSYATSPKHRLIGGFKVGGAAKPPAPSPSPGTP
jgi:predicted small lipoprotein YifL